MMKRVLSIAVLVVVLSVMLIIPVSAKTEVFWAESPPDGFTPLFLGGSIVGDDEAYSLGMQFSVTGVFSTFNIPFFGQGSLTLNIYPWYYNYDATIEQEPLRSVEHSVSEGFQKVSFEPLPAGEYVLLFTNAQATSHVGIYMVDFDYLLEDIEINTDAYTELYPYGSIVFDAGFEGTGFAELSSEQKVPASSTEPDTTPDVQVSTDPVNTMLPSSSAGDILPTQVPSADNDGDNGVLLYIVMGILVVVVAGAVVIIVVKRKKK